MLRSSLSLLWSIRSRIAALIASLVDGNSPMFTMTSIISNCFSGSLIVILSICFYSLWHHNSVRCMSDICLTHVSYMSANCLTKVWHLYAICLTIIIYIVYVGLAFGQNSYKKQRFCSIWNAWVAAAGTGELNFCIIFPPLITISNIYDVILLQSMWLPWLVKQYRTSMLKSLTAASM